MVQKILALICAIGLAAAASAAPGPATKPIEKIIALHLMPKSLVLKDARDVQYFLVLGETESHQRIDVTVSATFKAASSRTTAAPRRSTMRSPPSVIETTSPSSR